MEDQERQRSIEQEPSTSGIMRKLDELTLGIAKAQEVVRPPEKSIFPINATRQATHVRMRIYELVVNWTHTAAATITLTIGTKTFTLVGGANTNGFPPLPFPIILDRGTDISIAASAGTLGSCWLTYTPEE